MGTSRSTQRFGRATMRACERAKVSWEFPFQLIPTLREVRVLISMRPIRNVICLTDVRCPRVRFAVGGVITEWLHFLFSAFVHTQRVIVATGSMNPHFLESIRSSVGTVLPFQVPFERIIRNIRRCFYAHDVSILVDVVPGVRVTINAKCLVSSTMWTREGAEIMRELLFQL